MERLDYDLSQDLNQERQLKVVQQAYLQALIERMPAQPQVEPAPRLSVRIRRWLRQRPQGEGQPMLRPRTI